MQSASRIAAIASLVFAALALATARHADEKKGEVLLTPAEIKWREGPAALPKGVKMALLEGDPSKEGPFVMRLKLPDGFRVAPHTHRMDERVTVISGTLYLGMGGKFDEKACKALPVGSYTRMPPGMKHFGWAKGETVLQLNGQGPWVVEYVDPRDDPRKSK